MKALWKAAFGLALMSCGVIAHAQTAGDYPARSVRIVVPLAPGGATDVLARLCGAYMGTRFRQTFIIDNRPGAATQIGTDAVVKAPADGYTLLVQANVVASQEALDKDWPFKFERDLTTIGMFASGGYAIIASNSVPITNMRELVAFNKANPGKLNEAQAGGISTDMALLWHRIGATPPEKIMYKGAAPSVQAILAGESHVFAAAIVDILQFAKDGKLKVLATTQRQRHPLLPNAPTVAESGIGANDYEASFWFLLMGPAGLPQDITSKLNAAMLDLVKAPEFLEKLSAFGLQPESLQPQEARDRVRARVQLLQKITAEGVKLR